MNEKDHFTGRETQVAINSLMHLAMGNLSLDRILGQALDLILGLEWLNFACCGAVYLLGEDRNTLELRA